MSMSVEALNALSGMVNDSARTGIASYEASSLDEERRRRALLERYEMERRYGDEANGIRQELENGQDMVGRLKTLFGMNKQSADTSSSGGSNAYGGQQVQQINPTIEKLVDRAKGLGAYDIAKANVLEQAGQTSGKNAVDPVMQAYMIADAEERAKTGNKLDINTFKSRYEDTITQNQPIQGVNDLGNVAMDNSAERERLRKEIITQTNIPEEQKMIDAENRAIDKQNKAIEKRNTVAKANANSYNSQTKNNVKAVLPEKWEGNFGSQQGQVLNTFSSLIDDAVSRGDSKSAAKLNKEYHLNMKAVYKKFGEKYEVDDLYVAPKNGGGASTKYEDFRVTDKDGNFVDTLQLQPGALSPDNYAKTRAKLIKQGIITADHRLAPAGKNASSEDLKGQADASKIQIDNAQVISDNIMEAAKTKYGFGGGMVPENWVIEKWNSDPVNANNQIRVNDYGEFAYSGGGNNSNVASTGGKTSNAGEPNKVEQGIVYKKENGKVVKYVNGQRAE